MENNGLVWLYLGLVLGGGVIWLWWRMAEREERTDRQINAIRSEIWRLKNPEAAQAAENLSSIRG
jgi:hypothetical protein